jgi:lysophospholipase L1-like esterase
MRACGKLPQVAGVLLVACAAAAQPFGRVMALGDSITDGYQIPGGWRPTFAAGARRSFTFVGSLRNGDPPQAHEGHIGWTIAALDARIDGWLAESRPDLVLLMIGTNDVLSGEDLAHAPARLGRVVEHLAHAAPTARVRVASLPPIGDPRLQAEVARFNAALPGVIAALHLPRARFVDVGAALGPGDLADGVHPSAEGYRKLGAAWLRAVE